MKTNLIVAIIWSFLLPLVAHADAGCGAYFQLRDPATGRAVYRVELPCDLPIVGAPGTNVAYSPAPVVTTTRQTTKNPYDQMTLDLINKLTARIAEGPSKGSAASIKVLADLAAITASLSSRGNPVMLKQYQEKREEEERVAEIRRKRQQQEEEDSRTTGSLISIGGGNAIDAHGTFHTGTSSGYINSKSGEFVPNGTRPILGQ